MRVRLKKNTSWSTTSDFFIYIRIQELHKEKKQSNNHTHTKLTVPPFGSDEEKDNEIQLLKKNMNKNSAFFKICCGDLSIFINIEWLIGFIHPVEQHNSFFLSKLTCVLK